MPISLDFEGKLVIVTGGGRGIGWSITKALAQGGADVAITYTSKDASDLAAELSKSTGTTVRAFKCEVTNSKQVDAAVEAIEKSYGRKIDIGVANAGVTLWKEAHENTDDEFKSIFDVNTFGAFYLSRSLVRSWLGLPVGVSVDEPHIDVPNLKLNLGKQILFVSSISGLVAMNPQRQTAYNASKGAVTMMARSLAGEWSHLGIAVNSVSPGYVSTDMIANPPDEAARAWVAEWQKKTPVGRFASADEVGEFIAVLLSNKMGGAGFLAGSDVVIDGGYTIF